MSALSLIKLKLFEPRPRTPPTQAELCSAARREWLREHTAATLIAYLDKEQDPAKGSQAAREFLYYICQHSVFDNTITFSSTSEMEEYVRFELNQAAGRVRAELAHQPAAYKSGFLQNIVSWGQNLHHTPFEHDQARYDQNKKLAIVRMRMICHVFSWEISAAAKRVFIAFLMKALGHKATTSMGTDWFMYMLDAVSDTASEIALSEMVLRPQFEQLRDELVVAHHDLALIIQERIG